MSIIWSSSNRKLYHMEITQRQAELCSGLGDFHRLLMLYAIAERPHPVGELASRLNLPQPTVSRHLKILRDCGIVNADRQGKMVYYTLVDPRIMQSLDLLRAVLTDQMRHQGQAASTAAERPTV
jgi:DNA-binding transcriptional ArsR family regulator